MLSLGSASVREARWDQGFPRHTSSCSVHPFHSRFEFYPWSDKVWPCSVCLEDPELLTEDLKTLRQEAKASSSFTQCQRRQKGQIALLC